MIVELYSRGKVIDKLNVPEVPAVYDSIRDPNDVSWIVIHREWQVRSDQLDPSAPTAILVVRRYEPE